MQREKLIKIFSDIPTLKTERLTLRALRRTDSQDMHEYAADPSVTEFLLWSPHTSVSYTWEYLKYVENRYAVGDFYDWAVIESESGKMIGTCGFASIDTVNNSAQIGYVLNPAYHRQGIAVEAAKEVMRFGFDTLGLHRIEARFMQGNDASRKVMEKLGMTFEGFARDSMFVKGKYRTIGTCSITENDFRNKE